MVGKAKSARNQLRRGLKALAILVDFVEGRITAVPLLVESGEGLVSAGTTTLARIAAMTADQIDGVRLELRDKVRALAHGESVEMWPTRVAYRIVKHAAATPPRKSARRDRRIT